MNQYEILDQLAKDVMGFSNRRSDYREPKDNGYSVCRYDAELELKDDLNRKQQASLSACKQASCDIESANKKQGLELL